jgi:hypothetical protein
MVECEITPDEHLYTNPFFPKDGTSPVVGNQIGVYGPWVQDEGHGWRPEIHPCEMLWWRETVLGWKTYHLLVIQDDSNRFDKRDNFSGQIEHPWSAFPRHAEFRICVRVPRNERRSLMVEELYSREVRPVAPRNTPRVSRFGVGSAGGQVEVIRAFEDRTHIKIEIMEPFYTDPVTNESYGYVRLRCEVGNGNLGEEGYQILKITETS